MTNATDRSSLRFRGCKFKLIVYWGLGYAPSYAVWRLASRSAPVLIVNVGEA